jgi:hypothetical protein
MQTLTETIEFLTEAILNVQSDLSSDWLEEDDKRKMLVQLSLLINAKGCLDTIALSGTDSQIFRSSFKF